jgi:hypothetical protein
LRILVGFGQVLYWDIIEIVKIFTPGKVAHGLKIRGSVHEVFASFLGGGTVYRGCETFLGRIHLFGGFYCSLLTSFVIILEGRSTFIPPHSSFVHL